MTINVLSDVLSVLRERTAGCQDLYRRLSVVEKLAEREVVSGAGVPMPWGRRLALWRHGFTSRSGALFGVEPGEWERFVSDYRLELLGELGGRWADAADNKLVSHLLLAPFDDHLPDLYGLLDGGRLYRSLPTASTVGADPPMTGPTGAVEWIDSYLDVNDALVLKPVSGYGGEGVFVCRKDADTGTYRVNDEPESGSEFTALVDGLDEYLAWEFVEQADYAERLFPESTNTLRILTLWDYEADEPFIAGAVQRVGTGESAPVDNWGRGGLSAEVTADATLSRGARWSSSAGELHWHATHPDTGSRIEGVRVPNWSAIRERVLEMAATVPSLPRIGWDILPTTDAEFDVLEINTHPGIETLQVHRPLLDSERIRQFYDYHGYL